MNSAKRDRKQDLNILYQVCVFRAYRKKKMAAMASDLLRHFQVLLWNRWTEFNKIWQEAKSQPPLPNFVFFGPIGKTIWPSCPLIGWDIFNFSSETTEPNSKKLDLKQDLNVWGSTHFNLLGIDFSTNLNDIVRVNYGNVIPKIDALLNQWKRRLLTPIGRVTVLKTLIIPKLNHLFIALPNPSVEVLRNLSKKFFHFIWWKTI